MKKFKPVIFASISCAIIISVISYVVFEGDWPFLPYLLLAGFFMVLVQQETVVYKYLDKLLAGAILFGILTMLFISLGRFAQSYLLYGSSAPLGFPWSLDSFMMAAVFSFVSFLGGLAGIVLKGFYSLYRNRLDKVIIFLGPLLLLLSSLSILKVRIGGTIMSAMHGWPYPILIHHLKDVLNGFPIDRWILSPGSLYHYVILDYILYTAIFVTVFYSINLLNKKINTKKIDSTVFLFGFTVFFMMVFTSAGAVKQTYASYQIAAAGYCVSDEDCVIVANKAPFSCAIVANKDNAGRIRELVNSFPSTDELSCTGRERASCLRNKCVIDSKQTAEEINDVVWQRIKESVKNCEVDSIMQTHSLKVTAVLKTGEFIKATEPEIDDIFEIVTRTKDKCGQIIMATE